MNYRNLIINGAGIKGIALSGAIQVLEAQNILNQIESVAGISTGALVATLVALNYKAEEINKIFVDTNFKKFEDQFNPFRIFTSYGLYKGRYLKEWIEDKIINTGVPKDITFKKMNDNSNFKNLKLFATNLNTSELQEFSAERTPHVIVTEAIRASMSIPLYFKAWQFTNKYPNDHLFVDGSIIKYNNISIFRNLDETLLINVSVAQEYTWRSIKKRSIINYTKVLFDAIINSENIQFKNQIAEKKHSIIINDLGVSATNFKISNELKTRLLANGKEAAEKYFGVNRLFD